MTRTVQFVVRLSPDENAVLEAIARQSGQTRSAFIRLLIMNAAATNRPVAVPRRGRRREEVDNGQPVT